MQDQWNKFYSVAFHMTKMIQGNCSVQCAKTKKSIGGEFLCPPENVFLDNAFLPMNVTNKKNSIVHHICQKESCSVYEGEIKSYRQKSRYKSNYSRTLKGKILKFDILLTVWIS